ncbi:MAG: PQQ-binding-like beta-propeller repeat protein [Planctomycetota bacterium]
MARLTQRYREQEELDFKMKQLTRKVNSILPRAGGAAAMMLAVSVLLAGAVNEASAQNGVVSTSNVGHLGLKVDWMSQLDVGPRGTISGVGLHINENLARRYYEISYGTNREEISENDINAFGEEYGLDGALEQALVRKSVIEAELKARGMEDVEVTISNPVEAEDGSVSYVPSSLPKSTMYATTSRGLVAAIDADSGRTLWSTFVGNPRYLTTGPGYSDDYVAVCNGSRVYCLEAQTGKLLWDVESDGSPADAPSIGKHFVFVVLTNGRMQALPLNRDGIGGRTYIGSGLGTAAPLITERSVSWPTELGHYSVVPLTTQQRTIIENVGVFEAESIAYRLRADGAILSGGTAADGNLYVTSVDGFVYAVEERTGAIQWEFSTGNRIERSAWPYRGNLYLVTASNMLYKLNATNGTKAEGWEEPVEGISRFLGASGENLFVQDTNGGLVVLDELSGNQSGAADLQGVDFTLQNVQTNRIYLGNSNGLIQCVREVSSPTPVFHLNEIPMTAVAEAEMDTPDDEGVNSAPQQSDDPFSRMDSGNNPFGGSPAGGNNNPFGGGGSSTPAGNNNPFGGGAPAGGDNPFGGGAPASGGNNPFGGGSNDNPFGGG